MASIKDALKNFEAKYSTPELPVIAAEAEHVKLYGNVPPIVKMDNTLSSLKACKRLAISSNCIEKIAGLKGCEQLEILSLGRNQIKKLDGVEDVGETLQELWISYNLITSLKGIEKLGKLRVFYFAQNLVAKLTELDPLKECKTLELSTGAGLAGDESVLDGDWQELLLVGNPIHTEHSTIGDFREQIAGRMPWLKKLDGTPITEEERTAGAEKVA